MPARVTATALVVYFLLIGGIPVFELDPLIRIVNAAIGASLVVTYVVAVRRDSDDLDRFVLAALVLFALAGVLSSFVRQSFDAVLSAAALLAGFYHLRRMTADPNALRTLMVGMRTLSIVLTMLTASVWITAALAWIDITGGPIPTGLAVSGLFWGHRYDLALLLVILYPSWWLGNPGPVRRMTAIGLGGVVLTLVFLSGSRTLWLAVGAAGLLVAVRPLWQVIAANRRVAGAVGVAGLVAGVGLLASGVGNTVLTRLVASETLVARGEMWAILTTAWLEHPVAGLGPGSFPWALQSTDYFETNSWAPRHPDSILFQLLPEVGILGIAAAIVILYAIARPVWKSRLVAPSAVLTVIVVAGIGTNPTDFAFLNIAAMVWVAYAIPARPRQPTRSPPPSPTVTAALVTGGIVIGAAFIATMVSLVYYESARIAVARGDMPAASQALDVAVQLDPRMSLYRRERGISELLDGDPSSALRDLRAATDVNHRDDLAWRATAIAHENEGRHNEAIKAANIALELQRSDVTNVLVAAWLERSDGQRAESLLSEAVQSWPALVGAPGWHEFLPEDVSTADVVRAAIARWMNGTASLQPRLDQIYWLFAFGGVDDLSAAEAASSISAAMGEAEYAVLTCARGASARLSELPSADRRDPLYWALRVRTAQKSVLNEALMAFNLASTSDLGPASGSGTLNPLAESNGGLPTSDEWGYRRRPIPWPTSGLEVPSPSVGYALWLLNPDAAAREARLDSIGHC